jgi:menaquinone-dependent protoporphyrinogen oxidase
VRVLLSTASRYGATAEIGEAIGRALSAHAIDVTVESPARVSSLDGYDAFVLGSAVYMGRWLDDAKALVQRVSEARGPRPVWLFSSGPVGDPARKLVQQMGVDRAELAKLVEATGAREHKLFAGTLERHRLNRRQRAALLVMRGMEGDFRDWQEIARWSEHVAEQMQASRPPAVIA